MSAPAGAWRLDAALDGAAFEAVRERARAAGSRRGHLVRRALIVADVVGLAVAFFVAELLFGTSGDPADRVGRIAELGLFLATLPGWVVMAKLYRLYDNDDERADHSTIEDFVGVFHLLTVGTWCVVAVAWASGAAEPGMARLVTFWLLGVALVTIARGIARARCRRHPAYLQNTIVVGAGEVGQLVGRKLLMHREYGINLLGFVDADPRERRPDLEGLSVLGVPGRPAGARGESRRRARRHRLLRRDQRRHRSARRGAPGAKRSGRHCSAPLRRRRTARQDPCGRGASARRAPDVEALPVLEADQAGRGRRRRLVAPARLVADLRPRSVADPARVARPGVLPADAPRSEPARVHDPQVPHDARRHRRNRPQGVHRADDERGRGDAGETGSTSSNARTLSRAPGAGSARRAWTSCHNS